MADAVHADVLACLCRYAWKQQTRETCFLEDTRETEVSVPCAAGGDEAKSSTLWYEDGRAINKIEDAYYQAEIAVLSTSFYREEDDGSQLCDPGESGLLRDGYAIHSSRW